MGALNVINDSGASITLDAQGDIPDANIPPGVARGTIPTVNDATLTIQRNGTTVDTFTANQSTNTTANITTFDGNYNSLSNRPTIGNGTVTINAGTNLTGGGSFTTNQTGSSTITLNASGGSGVSTNVGVNGIGSMCLMSIFGTGNVGSGSNIGGSLIVHTVFNNSGALVNTGPLSTGTWRNITGKTIANNNYRTGTFQRIS